MKSKIEIENMGHQKNMCLSVVYSVTRGYAIDFWQSKLRILWASHHFVVVLTEGATC